MAMLHALVKPSRRGHWLIAGLVVVAIGAAGRGRSAGPSPHRADADCRTCHTADAATLARDPVAARTALLPDLDARCSACHTDEGPSHRTGMPPKGAVPPSLPLTASGQIGCGTCHFAHGENNDFGAYVRIDNRRGALCLTCHTLSELE